MSLNKGSKLEVCCFDANEQLKQNSAEIVLIAFFFFVFYSKAQLIEAVFFRKTNFRIILVAIVISLKSPDSLKLRSTDANKVNKKTRTRARGNEIFHPIGATLAFFVNWNKSFFNDEKFCWGRLGLSENFFN